MHLQGVGNGSAALALHLQHHGILFALHRQLILLPLCQPQLGLRNQR